MEVKFGVYLTPRGQLKTLFGKYELSGAMTHWHLDEGKKMKHPLFGHQVPVVKQMSPGWPVFENAGDLKGAEYLGDL